MMLCKLVAGSVLAAGLGAAGMMGAGTASALGFAVDPGDGNAVGSGCRSGGHDWEYVGKCVPGATGSWIFRSTVTATTSAHRQRL